jgi:aspartate/methionine/tyrosine aminotransferase
MGTTPADELNERLAAAHPAAAALLSGLGRRAFYPRGVPAQAAEAAGCRFNATIGQLTDGHGGALPLPAMARVLGPLGRGVLYGRQGGETALRAAWRGRLLRDGAPESVGTPLVTVGITHGLALAADLFAGRGTPVLVPAPGWGNYRHIFGMRRGAAVEGVPVLDGDRLAVDALAARLARLDRPAVLILNFPSNPLGYVPSPAEAARLVEVVAETPVPLAVLLDDAYAHMVWDGTRQATSLFGALVRRGGPRVVPIKLDGATKELFFFGGRVGFFTVGLEGAAAAVLEEKAMGVLRATVSSCPHPSQLAALAALEDPALDAEVEALRELIRRRGEALRAALDAHGLRPLPFHGGFFCLLPVPGDAEALRRRLLARGVGVVSHPEVGAIRLAYASLTAEDAAPMMEIIADTLRDHASASPG